MSVDQKLSQNFSWEEANVTTHRSIENVIPTQVMPVIRYTADCMERVRALLGTSISILSWYRSPELNTAVGGSKNSQHMQGNAVDFHSPAYGNPLKICQRINKFADMILFDQLIFEHTWIHISFNAVPGGKARKQVLTLLKTGKYAMGLTDKAGNPISAN